MVVENHTYGENTIFTVTLPSDVTENVTITIDGKSYSVKPDASGIAILTLNNISGGLHAVTATYPGDGNYSSASKSTTFVIGRAASSIDVNFTTPKLVDEDILVNVSMAQKINGTVILTVGSENYTVVITNGNGSYVIKGLANNTYSIKAVFAGNENYTDSTSTVKSLEINKVPIEVSISLDESVINVGDDAIVNVELNATINTTVTVKVNGKDYTVGIINGKGSLTLSDLANATYTINATFAGDDKYLANTSSNVILKVNKIASEIEVAVKLHVKVGEDAVITVTMNPSINATVTLTVDGKDYNVAVVNGKGGLNVSGLNSGVHEVNVTYAGDYKYVASNDTTTFTMGNATLDVNVTALNVTVKDNTTFIVEVPNDFNGNVSIKVGEDVLYNGTVKNIINAAKLLAGDKVATVVFYGDSNYDELTLNNVKFTVSKVDPEINVEIDDVTYPAKAVAEITVGNKANGTVVITIGDKEFSGTIENGEGSVDLTGLSAGAKVANVEFTSTDDYNNDATASAKFTVNKANSTIIISVDKVYVYNDTITIELTTTGSNGAVNVTINGKEYTVNNKQIVIDKLASGEYTIIAALAANENYTGAVNSTTFKVVPATSDISIDVNSIYKVGDDIVIEITVVNSTGAVNVTINGKEYAVDNNVITIAGGLPAGEYVVNAVLDGDGNYTGSSDTKSFNVIKHNITVTLDDVAGAVVGTPITFTAKLNETVTGDVIFTINGANYTVAVNNDNKATYTYTPVNNATLTVVATFTGNDKYNGNSFAVKVVEVGKIQTTIDVVVDSPIYVGQDAVITVNMNPTINTTVKLRIGDKTYDVAVVNGVGTYTASGLANATYTVNATFNGDDKYIKSTSNTATIKVNKMATDIIVTSNSPIYVGDDAIITIDMNPTINATVILSIGGKDYNVAVVNGKGFFNVSKLANDTYEVKVTFAGNDKYGESNNKTTLKVNKITDYEIKVNASDINFGENATIVVILPADVENADLIIEVDGDAKEHTMINGVVTISVPGLHSGQHEVNVTYLGDDKYGLNYNNGTKFNVNPTPKYDIVVDVNNHTYGEDTTFKVTLPHDVTENVTISIDGKNYSVKPDASGIATLTLNNLSGGLHSLVVSYPGDDEYAPNSKTTTFAIGRATSHVDVDFITPKLVGDDVVIDVSMAEKLNGTVTLTVGNNNYSVVITNGKGSYTVSGLANATYDVKAVFAGNENYTDSTSTIKQLEINKVPSELTINLEKSTILVTEKAIVNVVLDQNINAVVSVKVNDDTYDVAIVNGKGKLILSDLAKGTYTISATFDGNDKYIGDTSNVVTLTVEGKLTPEMEVTVDEENNVVKVELPEDATGNVTVKIDGVEYNVTNITEKPVIIGIDDLAPGNHTVEVIYSGDDKYESASEMAHIEVPKIVDYDMTVDAKVDGRDVDITVNLPSVDGVVLIDVGGTGYYANVTKGQAKLHLSDVANGNYDVTAKYLGDDKYGPGENTTSFTIEEKVKPEMEITIDIPENSTEGTVKVDLPEDATGNVTVVIDGKVYNVSDVVNGTATIPISGLTPGNHTVEVIYSGDDNYTGASNATIVNVPKIKDYDMNVTAKDINVGDKTDITVNLPKDVTGVVLVDIDGIGYYVNVKDGVAKVNLPIDLKPGTYDVVVTYPGDDKYDSKSVTDSFEVVSNTPEIDIKVDDDKIIVELPEDATGNVTVTIDGKNYTVPVKDGKAELDISDLEPGNHTVDVTYPGDDKYGPASNSTTVEVPKIVDYPVDITKDGDNLVVDVPDDATGDVTVTIDGKNYTVPIKDGKAVVDISDLAPGNHDVKVTYPGDNKYGPATNSTTINVPKKSDYPIDVAVDGDNLVVDVPDDATGNVTVNIDGKDYTVPIKDGKAVVDISDLPSGKHDVKVTYPGDDKYASKTVETTIDKERSLIITVPDVVKYYSGPERLVIYTKDNNGHNVDGIEVKITINGITYTRVSENGQASLGINLESGNYTVKVEFAGNSEFGPQTVTANVEVLPTIYAKDVLKVFRNGTQYYALFLDGNGNPLVNTDVIFNIHGVFYTRTTNASGWAKLNINIEKGQYILTAYNPVTGEQKANTITVITLIESSDLVKHFRNGTQFVARIHSDDGGWVGAGAEVTFNIHGVFYTRTTNATGHVKLNINLEPGDYIISTYYKDCIEGNKIKVLPRLITSDLTMKYGDGSSFVAKTLDEKGNPAPHQLVSFNIHGILYNRTTNDEGVAAIKLNLQPGEYHITSQYGYEVNGNKVTIEA